MVTTIFKIIQPYLRRYLAKQAAEYLQKRRERRLAPANEEPPSDVGACKPAGLPGGEAFWFTMSGLLLGSALGYMLAYLTRKVD